MSEKTITMYPGNWLYNAAVLGFLRLLKDDVKKLFHENAVILTEDISKKLQVITQENLTEWAFRYINVSAEHFGFHENDLNDKYVNVINKRLSGQKGYYTNLITMASKDGNISKSVPKLNEKIKWLYPEDEKGAKQKPKKTTLTCSFCIKRYQINKADASKFVFQNKFLSLLGGSMINLFWNCTPNLYLCPECSFFLIHNHLAFINTIDGEIFINAPSFKTMWYLNQYAERIFNKSDTRNILAMSVMEYSQKINATIGVWSFSNIEMIRKKYDYEQKRTVIDELSLPYEKTRLLLNRKISALISATKEPFILETVLSGRYDDLLKLNERILKTVQARKVNEKENYICRLRDKSIPNFNALCKILPELYILINKQLVEEVI
ncbi:hypothetical protein DS62_13960 [Smithella sp. SC_K08D17]|nr:hypothetical protein DS62_13960 [Smithella sp. SC_K08D17]